MNYTIFLDNYAVNENGYMTKSGIYKKKTTETDKDFTVYNAKASLELNAAGSLEFTMPPTHPRYNGYKYYVGDNYKKAKKRYTAAINGVNSSIPEYKDMILDGSAECSFGNIDMNSRARHTWTESGTNSSNTMIKAAASWDYTPVKDEYETVYPKTLSFTIEGVSEKVYVLMSPLIFLNPSVSWVPKKVAKSYIRDILTKSVSNGIIDKSKALRLDREGMTVSKTIIRRMIAVVCLASELGEEELDKKSSLLTYAGKYGKVQCAKDDMANAPTKNKYWTKGLVLLREDKNFIFAGRAYAYSIDIYKRKTITIEGALNFLKDSIQPAKEYIDQTLYNIVCSWLDIHNKQVDDNRKIYPGDLTRLKFSEVYRITDYETTWDCLQKFVLDTNGGYFAISIDGSYVGKLPYLYLDYYTDTTSTRESNGKVTKLINDQVMRFKENLLDITENFSLDGIYTKVLPLGKIKTEEEDEEEESGDDSGGGGGSSTPTDINSLGKTAQGTGVATGTGTWIRSGPGGSYDPIGEYPWINGGDRVDVCDIAYNDSGEGWLYVRAVRSYYGFVNPLEFDAQVSLSKLPHYRG